MKQEEHPVEILILRDLPWGVYPLTRHELVFGTSWRQIFFFGVGSCLFEGTMCYLFV